MIPIVAQRILRTFRTGGSLPVLVESDRGRWVVKLRGAAQGTTALVAEIIVAELARTLGLPVPELALIELGEETPTDDRNDELADLLQKSVGLNLGFRFLDGATDLRLDQLYRVEPLQAVTILWLDRFVENRDRTKASPNILLQKGKVWLIDFGAALPFAHDWEVTEQTPRDASMITWDHLFSDFESGLRDVDARAAALLDRPCLERAVQAVPDAFLRELLPTQSTERSRAAYVAFLRKRLESPRAFVQS